MGTGLKNALKSNCGVVAVLLLALAVRAWYLYYYSTLPDWTQLTVDNYYHHHWAQSIAGGNILGDTTYFRAPFYVFCLGLLYALWGSSLWVARLFGLAVGMASVMMTYLMGKRFFNARVGLIAALIQSVYPIVIYFEGELLLDPLFMLLLQLFVHRLLIWHENKSVKSALCAGLWLGLAAITRPTALVFVPVTVLVFIATLRRTRLWEKPVTAFLVGVLLLIAPITIRNLAVAGDPVLIASQGGINLYIGNNPQADGVSAVLPEPFGHNWQIKDITYRAEQATGKQLTPGAVSNFWMRRALDWMARHPGEFVILYGKKLYYSFSDREVSNNRELSSFFNRIPLLKYNPLSFGILFIFSVVGVAAGLRQKASVRLLVLLVVSYIFVMSLFFFTSRFRLPLLPYYFLLSAFGLVALIQRMRLQRKTIVPLAFMALAAGLFSFYPIVPLPKGASPVSIISKGLHYYARSDYRQALRYYLTALDVDSTFPEGNLNVGACFLKLGNADSARYYFDREKRFNPQRVKAYVNMASLYLVSGRYDSAFNEVQHALKLRPYDITANMLLLRSASAKQEINNDSLFKMAVRAARNTKEDIYLLNDAAALLTERGALKEAETLLLKAVYAQPPPIETDDEAFSPVFRNSPGKWLKQRAKAHYQLGYLYGLQGDYDNAVRYSSLAIRLDSSLVEAYVNLISGLVTTGRLEEAKSILKTAQQKFPRNRYLSRLQQYFQ
jgi:4-amino-4-deoxy-L-arabinose transferase-like glycosyltransferase